MTVSDGQQEVNIMTGKALAIETEERLGSALASRIADLRRQRELSLDGLAKLAGLSKGTVVALEQGKANPSIGVLCRLAAAFSVSVSDLVGGPVTSVSEAATERTTTKILWTSAKGSEARLLASTSGRTMFELWAWTIMPGDGFQADAHSPGTRELISVERGSLRITVGTQALTLNAGESARLITDQPHSYVAAGEEPAVFTMAVLEQGAQR
jgi:transcriptional regulator with XRE-family HTH domain